MHVHRDHAHVSGRAIHGGLNPPARVLRIRHWHARYLQSVDHVTHGRAGKYPHTGAALKRRFLMHHMPALVKGRSHDIVRSPHFLDTDHVRLARVEPLLKTLLESGPDSVDVDSHNAHADSLVISSDAQRSPPRW